MNWLVSCQWKFGIKNSLYVGWLIPACCELLETVQNNLRPILQLSMSRLSFKNFRDWVSALEPRSQLGVQKAAHFQNGASMSKVWVLVSDYSEAVCLVRCLGRSQLISSLSPLVNKLFGGILSLAQTLIRSVTERQLSHKVHAYLVHNSFTGTKIT